MNEAGHTWNEHGQCVGVLPATGNICGRRWVDILNTQASEVGQEGIAHVGNLNQSEYESIAKRREAEMARFANAMNGVAVGAGR